MIEDETVVTKIRFHNRGIMDNKSNKPHSGVPEWLKKDKSTKPAQEASPKKVKQKASPTLLFYIIAFLFILYVALTLHVLFTNPAG